MHKFCFVILICLASCSTSIPRKSNLFTSKEDFISVMQGATDKTSTVINFIIPKNYSHIIDISDSSGNRIQSFSTQKKQLLQPQNNSGGFPWELVNVAITNLNPSMKYTFRLTLQSRSHKFEQTRFFSTLNTDKRDWKILIASCFNDDLADTIGAKMWANAHQKKADAYFFIGDNVYADFYNGYGIGYPIDARHLWDRFIDARLKYDFFRQKKLVPVFAVWDDHDFGANNGNRHLKIKEDSKRIFRNFFPLINSPNLKTGPGISFNLSLGDERFYFFDNRYFRDNEGEESQLGKKQLQWFEKSLNLWTEGQRAHLIQGDQFFGKFDNIETYESDHSKEFKSFLNILRKSNKKFNFISGDRHFLELAKVSESKYGHSSYEITTSAMHAKIFPGAFEKFPNPNRIAGTDNQYNYVIMDLRHGTDEYSEVELRGYNEKDEVLLNHKFHL